MAKMPGIVKDPWRSVPAMAPGRPPQPETTNSVAETEAKAEAAAAEGLPQVPTSSTLVLKGYGGITVDGVDEPTLAALRVLEFCVDHRKEIDAILTEFSIVVARMEIQKTNNIKFYIQRKDGWLLAVPGAVNRDAGYVLLIQALLKMQASPTLKKQLESYYIRPYKV